MDNSCNFDPLAWAAASTNNAAMGKGQAQPAPMNNLQSYASLLPRAVDNADAKADLLAVVNELLVRRVNITESYGDWIKVGFALAEELGAEGREPFHQLSSLSAKYNPAECERKWHSLLRSNTGRVTKNTLFWLAEQAGIRVSKL